MLRTCLVVGAGLGLMAAATASAEATDPAKAADKATPIREVRVQARKENTRAKLLHILREVDGTKITVTRKSSTAILDQQARSPGEQPRERFARTPGVLLLDEPTPVRFDLAYRGLGEVKGGQGVLVLEDGLPIGADIVGDPTLYYLPFQQRTAQVQLLRGGSSLVYGPDAAAINFLSQRPAPGAPFSASSEQIGGSDGLFSSWNAVQGSQGRFDGRVAFGWRQSDGEQANSAYRAHEADVWLGFHPAAGQLLYLDLSADGVDAGDPGLLGAAQALATPGLSLTPDNHALTRRYAATLGAEVDFARGWRFEGKLRGVAQDIWRRAADPQTPGGPPPGETTLQESLYESIDADLRLKKSWARGNALTFGVEAFHDLSPLRQWLSPDLTAPLGAPPPGGLNLSETRRSDYDAVFVENVFRLPHRIHVVPSLRLEHEGVAVAETVKPVGLTRPLIDAGTTHDTPRLGLGVGNDFGKDNESYFSVTQSWRPLGFADIASPFTNAQPGPSAAASRSLSWEAGAHGTPVTGFFYDASLFWITTRNHVETEALNGLDTVNVDTGDTRSRGFEGEVAYDLFKARADGSHLNLFTDLTLLDARFIGSDLPDQVGRVPAYAPHVMVQAGVTWRHGDLWTLSLTGRAVGAEFFQDSDLSAGAGSTFVPARIPAYRVLDVTGDWRLTRHVRLLAGVRNLGDDRYYAFAQQTGVAPAPGRTVYAGLKFGL